MRKYSDILNFYLYTDIFINDGEAREVNFAYFCS